MMEIFLRWQLTVYAVLAVASSLTVLLIDFRGFVVVVYSLLCLIPIFIGQKLFTGNTSENWLKLSFGEILKNALGGALLLIGWISFLRIVVAIAIAAIILKIG